MTAHRSPTPTQPRVTGTHRERTARWILPTAALVLALAGCGPSAGHEEVGVSIPTPTISTAETSIFELSPGQCFDRPADGDGLYRVSVVPCEVAHDQEMYAVFQLDRPQWPGQDRVQQEATDRCAGEFLAFTGTPAEESRLGFTSFVPSEGSWSEGDRQVLCALELDSGGRLLGSQAGRGE